MSGFKNYVEVPAYHDRWMMGDRMGTIVKVSKVTAMEIHENIRPKHLKPEDLVEIAHVKLDISGKVRRFILDDCTPR